MIVQLSSVTPFADTSSPQLKLPGASAGGTHLVAAFVFEGALLPAITAVVDSLGCRWRLATDTGLSSGRRAMYFVRPVSPAGVTELTATTANNIEVTGFGLVLEASGIRQGEAIQYAADLILEVER